ncbi:MAG: PLP-dependent aminotransferase family protein [Alsobacter sp.]
MLYAEIRRLIEAGRLAPGTKLPTTRDLATRLNLSRGAAVAAFEMLLADGFAVARVGSGTFVADQVPHVSRMASKEAEPAALSVAVAHAVLPGELGIARADPRTMRILRGLLNRSLARPTPSFFGYGDPRGGHELREAVADYLRVARGVRCHSEQVVMTSGSQQALDLIIRAALIPGDHVWIEDPCYPKARAAFVAAGIGLAPVPVDREGLDPAAGAARAPHARAVYVTPSHQFPLGTTLSMRRRLDLIDWARRADAWIIEDDYDSEFRYSGPPLTSLQGIDEGQRVIYVGTLSKALFPGLRAGYLVAPEALLNAIKAVRDRIDRFPSALIEGALTEFLREGHFASHLRRARRHARASRDALVEGLSHGPLAVTAPDQGLHLIAQLPFNMEDREAVTSARHAGLGARALSPMYLEAPARQGLVIGFSGFEPAVIETVARRWTSRLRRPR